MQKARTTLESMSDKKKVQCNLSEALLAEILSITTEQGIGSNQGAVEQACLFYVALLRSMKKGEPINWVMQDCRLAVSTVGRQIGPPRT